MYKIYHATIVKDATFNGVSTSLDVKIIEFDNIDDADTAYEALTTISYRTGVSYVTTKLY